MYFRFGIPAKAVVGSCYGLSKCCLSLCELMIFEVIVGDVGKCSNDVAAHLAVSAFLKPEEQRTLYMSLPSNIDMV
jgi:hypothetical protein